MTTIICKACFNLVAVMAFVFPLVAYAKPMPSELSDLVVESDLVAVVDVYNLHSEGKSTSGYAAARITNVLSGEEKNKIK